MSGPMVKGNKHAMGGWSVLVGSAGGTTGGLDMSRHGAAEYHKSVTYNGGLFYGVRFHSS